MTDTPRFAADYDSAFTRLVRRTCLTVAVRLHDLIDETVIVGGLAPGLTIDAASKPTDTAEHIGTQDLDIGLSLAIFDDQRYQAIAERLRAAGFRPELIDQGRTRRQRWSLEGQPQSVGVDFLIPQTSQVQQGGKLQNLEADFAAWVIEGLEHAFADKQTITLSDTTLEGDQAQRQVHVVGPGAFVILKALAFRGRGKEKDAYDLWYMLQYHADGIDGIASRIQSLPRDSQVEKAITILQEDFQDLDGIGIGSAARFLQAEGDDNFRADFSGAIRALLLQLGSYDT